MSDDFRSEQDRLSSNDEDSAKAIKAALDSASRAAAESRDAVAAAVKQAGAAAADQLNALSDSAQEHAGHSAANLTNSVSANPIAALAIAAGAGFVFGLALRGGRR